MINGLIELVVVAELYCRVNASQAMILAINDLNIK